jgi:hypothetical protein
VFSFSRERIARSFNNIEWQAADVTTGVTTGRGAWGFFERARFGTPVAPDAQQILLSVLSTLGLAGHTTRW